MTVMDNKAPAIDLDTEQIIQTGGGLYRPGEHRKEALAFLKERVGEKRFEQIMGRADGRQHPYVAARVFLSPLDWDRYVWIEHHGTLEGFL